MTKTIYQNINILTVKRSFSMKLVEKFVINLHEKIFDPITFNMMQLNFMSVEIPHGDYHES